jgi:uncharacterized membrane protein YkoI
MIAATRKMMCRMAVLVALFPPALALAQSSPGSVPEPKVSAEQAKAAALKKVSGRVTSVDIEKKQGRFVYVVEIRTGAGAEKDVLVDIDTGQVLAVDD